jgi:ABC-type glycerol-3-phosphate transport system permease component
MTARRASRQARREAAEGVLFAAPLLFGLAVFTVWPVVRSLFISFTRYDIFTPPVFVGLHNYAALFHDRLFWQSLKITTLYSLAGVPLQLVIGLAVALLMNRKVRGITLFRTIYYLPAVVSGVAVSLLWVWIFNPDYGLANITLSAVGLPPQWIPHPVVWRNFADGWTTLPFTLYLKNTCIITASVILGTLLTASLAAYSFARLRWSGRDVVFLATLATLMLPAQVTMIPVFLMFRDLGWLNTFAPLTVGAWLGGGAVNIFLIRQFMLTIPLELEEAARIDGCGTFGIYWRIVLPLLKTCLAVIAIFTFLGTWNDFMGPLIYLTTPDKATLALGLQFFQGRYGVTLPYLMAVSLIVMAPCLLLFLAAQRLFVSGIALIGIKG